jgi:hypothetical protein
MSKIYVASSWRNDIQPQIVKLLRENGHEVYDFKNPTEDEHGFHWSEIDPNWKEWDCKEYITSLAHPIAEHGFSRDWGAMQWADTCVLVLPCGRSAHIEAGYFVGANKRLIIFIVKDEPELMYKMATKICYTFEGLLKEVGIIDLSYEVQL